MDVDVSLPGTKPGRTSLNVAVIFLYLITFPIWMTLAPLFVGVIVGLNAGGWADALASLPGIRKEGGLGSGIVAFGYIIVFWYLFYLSTTLF